MWLRASGGRVACGPGSLFAQQPKRAVGVGYVTAGAAFDVRAIA
jgi:hypothetical protein